MSVKDLLSDKFLFFTRGYLFMFCSFPHSIGGTSVHINIKKKTVSNGESAKGNVKSEKLTMSK